MKLKVFLTSLAGAALLASGAGAGEWADACTQRLEADGRDTSGCACLEEQIDANSPLADEFRTLAEIEDPAVRYSSASGDAQAAMNACTR